MKQLQKIVAKTIEKYFIDEKLHEDIAGIHWGVCFYCLFLFLSRWKSRQWHWKNVHIDSLKIISPTLSSLTPFFKVNKQII